jgi:hypothetical protein
MGESVPQAGSKVPQVIDLAVKTAVIVAAVVYACGFLVISIYQYRYGLSVLNPLRPKVLAAGTWLIFFVVIPFIFAFEGRATSSTMTSSLGNWRNKPSSRLCVLGISCFWLAWVLRVIFDCPSVEMMKEPSDGSILAAMVIAAALVSLDSVWNRLPSWLPWIGSLGFVGLLIFCGFRDALKYHCASAAALSLWFLFGTFAAWHEMASRDWKLVAKNWTQTIAALIAAVAVFSGFYYPKLKPSWGGGASVPATLYFSNDSSLLPGTSVPARIVDETDGGVYVVSGNGGKEDEKATFIPRSQIEMIYYSSDPNGSFLAKPPLPPVSNSPNKPQPSGAERDVKPTASK